MSQILDKVREKYPQYDSLSDEELAFRLGEKYPVYLKQDTQFNDEYQAAKYNRAAGDYNDDSEKMASGLGELSSDVQRAQQASAPVIEALQTATPKKNFIERFADRGDIHSSFTSFPPEMSEAVDAASKPIKEIIPSEIFKPEAIQHELDTLKGKHSQQEREDEYLKAPIQPSTQAQVISGVGQEAANTANFFTSPLGIATLGMGALPKGMQRMVSGAFAAQMASQTPELARQLGEELGKPEDQRDPEKISRLVTQAVATTGFTVAGALHALKPGADMPLTMKGDLQGPDASGSMIQSPRGAAAPRAETPEGIQRTTPEQSAALSDQMTAKATAATELYREADQIAQAGAPATAAALKDQASTPISPITPKPKESNANSQQIPVEVDGGQSPGNPETVAARKPEEVQQAPGAKEETVGTQPIAPAAESTQTAPNAPEVSSTPVRTDEVAAVRPAAENVGQGGEAPAETAKEPWQMTQAEYVAANADKVRGDVSTEDKAAVLKNSGFHKRHVEQALKEGKPVPHEVLADYPELLNASELSDENKPAGWSDERWEIFKRQRAQAIEAQKERNGKFVPPKSPEENKPSSSEASPQNSAREEVQNQGAGAEADADPNIGRTWNSPYGKQVITRTEHFGGQDHYVVTTEGSGAERVYSKSQIEDVIKRNEHALTPEYAKEQADAEELRRLKAEREKKEQEKQAKLESEIAEFTKGKTPMAAGKIKAALLKQVSNNGVPTTRKALIEDRISKGSRVVVRNGARELTNPDESFFDEKTITKAGMDYAEYLSKKSEQLGNSEQLKNQPSGKTGELESNQPATDTPTQATDKIESQVEKVAESQGQRPDSDTPKISDEVTWKTGAGDMARSTVQRITKLPNDTEPMADVDWFGPKRVPVSQLKIVKKSSRRIAEEARTNKPVETTASASKKIETQVKKTAAESGQRPAKEVKSELVSRLEKSIDDAPASADLKEGRFGVKIYPKGTPEKVTIEIPGDGTFTVPNTKEALAEVLNRAKKISTASNSEKKAPTNGPGNISDQAQKVIQAYGSAENAYLSAKRQRDALPDNDPETPDKTEAADSIIKELYSHTKAAKAEVSAERNRDLAKTYREGAEGFQKEIAKLEAMKNPSKANKERLEDLKTRYAENQRRIAEYDQKAEQAAQQAAKEKAALESDPATPEKPGKIVGMGGAIPEEFGGDNSYVSNMFAAIDRDRAAMGKPPMPETKARTWDEDNARALAEMNRNPDWAKNLVQQVLERPRPLLSWENAGLVWHRYKLKAELNNAFERINRAHEDGREEDKAAAQVDASNFEDQIEELDRAVGRNGTGSEAGRSLQAQKMAAAEDWTLAEMRLRKRAAVGGRPLTKAEQTEIQRLHDEINRTQKALDDYKAQAEDKIREANAKAELARIAAEAKQPAIHPKILEAANKIVSAIDAKADAARKRIRERLSRVSAGVDPTLILDLAEIGASHLAHGIVDAAKWTAKMVEDVGEWVKPHLDAVRAESEKLIDKATATAPEPVKKAIKKLSDLKPTEQREKIAKGVADNMAKGKKDKIAWQVRKIARSFVEEGIKDREDLVDAVHDLIKDQIPGWTRRQTMDAISGYGDFKQLSKDQITVTLRGIKGELQQISKLEDMANGVPPKKSGVERRTPTDAERQLIKKVNGAKYKFQVPVQDPNTQLKSALDTLKTTLANRIKDYEDRLARKDFAPRPRSEIQLDREAMRLKAENERVKKKYTEALRADRLKNRTPWEKTLDWGTKFRRFAVLSSPAVVGKLVMAGMERLAFTLPEEAVGSVWKRIPGVSQIAERAPLEGRGMMLKAEMQSYGKAFTQGMRDAYNVLKKGHSDLDVLYGKASESYTGENELGSAMLELPGRIHGALKSPVKRANFERAVQRLGEYYARQGLDVTDDLVKSRIAIEAYKAANRSIFLDDNRIASGINAFLGRLEAKDKATGKPTFGGKLAATTVRTLLPIVKVPTNIVAETMQYAGGLASSPLRIIHALVAGVEKLPPERADLIMRELKKGSLGAAVLALGYFSSDFVQAGGFYQQGEKRKPNDLKPGHARIFGHDFSPMMLHHPLLETLQIGATARRVADSKLRARDEDKQGLVAGIGAAAIGISEEVPLVKMGVDSHKLFDRYTRDKYIGDTLRSILVPSVVQKVAEKTDSAAKRYPRTIVQGIEQGIPWLRQNVPDTKPRAGR